MNNFFKLILSLITVALAGHAMACGIPANEELRSYYYEYSNATAWSLEVMQTADDAGTPHKATTTLPPTDVASALSVLTYSENTIHPSMNDTCTNQITFYVGFYKYPSSSCAFAANDIIFGIKAFV